MAGHSKWANIRFRKGKQDAARNKVFTKLARVITVAARVGTDPNNNAALRLAMDKAQRMNMGKDIIQRAIAKASKSQEADNLVNIRYEGYGPAGVAFWVHALTDNRNRTVAEVRHAFSKYGGSMGVEGCVSYLFNHQGTIFCKSDDEESLIDIAIEFGAEDVKSFGDGSFEVITSPSEFERIRNQLEEQQIVIEDAELTYNAETSVDCDQSQSESVVKLMDTLENLDDVQSVYINAQLSSE